MISPSIVNTASVSNPSLSGGVLANRAKGKADGTSTSASSAPSASSGASQTSLTSLGSTFLKLLTQELQNQDPTSPMDSTQMVGQMISLNQLDQLASINQLLTTQFGTPASPATTSSVTPT